MGRTIEAVYDGRVFRPMEPVTLEPNTRVQILLEAGAAAHEVVESFLDCARSLNLDGPADWSANLERYLYGDGEEDED